MADSNETVRPDDILHQDIAAARQQTAGNDLFQHLHPRTRAALVQRLDQVADHLHQVDAITSVAKEAGKQVPDQAERLAVIRGESVAILSQVQSADPAHTADYDRIKGALTQGDIGAASRGMRSVADDNAFVPGKHRLDRHDPTAGDRVQHILDEVSAGARDPGSVDRAALRNGLAEAARGDAPRADAYRDVLRSWDRLQSEDRPDPTPVADQFADLQFARGHARIQEQMTGIRAWQTLSAAVDHARAGETQTVSPEQLADAARIMGEREEQHQSAFASLPSILAKDPEQAGKIWEEATRELKDKAHERSAFDLLGDAAKGEIDRFTQWLQAKYDNAVSGHEKMVDLHRHDRRIQQGLTLAAAADPDNRSLYEGVRVAHDLDDPGLALGSLRTANRNRMAGRSDRTPDELTVEKHAILRAVGTARTSEERARQLEAAGYIEQVQSQGNSYQVVFIERASLSKGETRAVTTEQLGLTKDLDYRKTVIERNARGEAGLTADEMRQLDVLSTKQPDQDLQAMLPYQRSKAAIHQGRMMALEAELVAVDRAGVTFTVSEPDGSQRTATASALFREERQQLRQDAFNRGAGEPEADAVFASLAAKRGVDLKGALHRKDIDQDARAILGEHVQARLLTVHKRMTDEGAMPTFAATQARLMPEDAERKLAVIDALSGYDQEGVSLGGDAGGTARADRALARIGLRLESRQRPGQAQREVVLVEVANPKREVDVQAMGLTGANSLSAIKQRLDAGERGISHQDRDQLQAGIQGDGIRMVRTGAAGPDGKARQDYSFELFTASGRRVTISAVDAGLDPQKHPERDPFIMHQAAEQAAHEQKTLLAVRSTMPKGGNINFSRWNERLKERGLELVPMTKRDTGLKDRDGLGITGVSWAVQDPSTKQIVTFEKLGLGKDELMVRQDGSLYTQGQDRRDLVGRAFRDCWRTMGEIAQGRHGFMSPGVFDVGKNDARHRMLEEHQRQQRGREPGLRELTSSGRDR